MQGLQFRIMGEARAHPLPMDLDKGKFELRHAHHLLYRMEVFSTVDLRAISTLASLSLAPRKGDSGVL